MKIKATDSFLYRKIYITMNKRKEKISMEQIKLGNGNQYELAVNGIVETNNEEIEIIVVPGSKTFSEIETDFENTVNTQRMEILDSIGEIMDAKKGYTYLKSIKKQNDYILGTNKNEIGGETIYENITGTVYFLRLAKPDLRKQVNDIQDTVDILVLGELGV